MKLYSQEAPGRPVKGFGTPFSEIEQGALVLGSFVGPPAPLYQPRLLGGQPPSDGAESHLEGICTPCGAQEETEVWRFAGSSSRTFPHGSPSELSCPPLAEIRNPPLQNRVLINFTNCMLNQDVLIGT